jgi:UrcA family protein
MAMIRSTIGTTADASIFKGGAGAGQGDRARKYRVRFEDLNLSRKDDIKILYQRIRAAAESVCSPLSHTHRLAIHRKWIDCRALEVANAVAEIDHPGLTEYHRQLTSHALEGA